MSERDRAWTAGPKLEAPEGVDARLSEAPRDLEDRMMPEEMDVVLSLSDLIPDMNGEVVLFNDSQFESVQIVSSADVVGSGTANGHVTAAGDDVSGFRYLTFSSGITLYHSPDLVILCVRDEN